MLTCMTGHPPPWLIAGKASALVEPRLGEKAGEIRPPPEKESIFYVYGHAT